MLGEEHVSLRLAPPEREVSSVAHRGEEAARHKRLPVVGVEHDMPDGPFAAYVRHPPVVSDAVADHPLVFAHGLRGHADVLAVARQDHVGETGLAAELVHDLGGLAPVRVDEASLDVHRRPVVSRELPRKVVLGERLEAAVEASFEACVRELPLKGRVRVREREASSLLVGPCAVVDHGGLRAVGESSVCHTSCFYRIDFNMASTSAMLGCHHVSQSASGISYSKYSHSGDGAYSDFTQ